MVFQSYALWPHMTVEQNVAFGLQLRKVPAADQSRRIAEALALVHMQDLAKRKPNQLSGGQQQRVALARALVIRPDVLLLDEPLSNLDAKLRTELRSEIRRICKTGGNAQGASPSPITTVYVTHDQKEALSMADRMAVLNKGRIVALGTPRDLYRNPPSTFVAAFLGETNFIPIESAQSPVPRPLRSTSPAGPLTTSHTIPSAPRLTASIRPEAFHIHDAARPRRPPPPSSAAHSSIPPTSANSPSSPSPSPATSPSVPPHPTPPLHSPPTLPSPSPSTPTTSSSSPQTDHHQNHPAAQPYLPT
jgi:iron(III) transport system ATP-binding protein